MASHNSISDNNTTNPALPNVLRGTLVGLCEHYIELSKQWRNIGARYHHLTLSARTSNATTESERAMLALISKHFCPSDSDIAVARTLEHDNPEIWRALNDTEDLFPRDLVRMTATVMQEAKARIVALLRMLEQMQECYDAIAGAVDALLLVPDSVHPLKELPEHEREEMRRLMRRWAYTLPEMRRQLDGAADGEEQEALLKKLGSRFFSLEEMEGLEILRATGRHDLSAGQKHNVRVFFTGFAEPRILES
ncbi:uncharacterized protein K452DRAFT_301608 [Aplosporella prunicola CBS 121167]|uniref:Uncharacterized protein n=1 Tax=Aplosporella prunicola CBS 121167 TaxID=1176127 RepID=A0A6A6B3D7_9PEZI|nr:uncharacterized protein K452DRAFT_301608 [Aplosporella prunicola CBS 121167]KAF2137883.1 hypothetical protein K452DRAFT_301608 [Aplosporella prunicola CBS 121167]